MSDIRGTRLRLLSYNIQVGIATHRPHHYLTRSLRHFLPHAEHFQNLNMIADFVRHYDVVALQEVDAGSLRSSFVNQTDYLAEKAGFRHHYSQNNRNLGHIARHSNGLLSRFHADVENHKLPGRVPGRGAMLARFGDEHNPLVMVLLHLALGKRARTEQLEYVAELVSDYEHVVVMGDMNCQPDAEEMQMFVERTGLHSPAMDLHTFPSWKPSKKLDHILVSPSLKVENAHVEDKPYSDHLPIAMDVVVPEAVSMVA